MPKEQTYKAQLEALGVYDEAFDPAIHALCIQERELSRTMKAWKATAPKNESPSPLHELYSVIRDQRRDIAALRDSLGLTPKGLQKLRGRATAASPESEKTAIAAKLDLIAARVSSYE